DVVADAFAEEENRLLAPADAREPVRDGRHFFEHRARVEFPLLPVHVLRRASTAGRALARRVDVVLELVQGRRPRCRPRELLDGETQQALVAREFLAVTAAAPH